MSTAGVTRSRFTALSLLAVGLVAADLASTASATMVTYNFAGIISGGSGSSNAIPVDLQGQFSIGQPVTLTYVIDTSTAQSTAPPLNTYPSMGYYPDAVDTWSLTYGTYTASGTGGYATVCDSTNTEGLNANCPNPYFPGFPASGSNDGVRFVGWSTDYLAPMVDGYSLCASNVLPEWSNHRQCSNVNIFDPSGTAFSGVALPSLLDPAVFPGGTGAQNNSRLQFTKLDPTTGAVIASAFITGTISPVPEPSTLALACIGAFGALAGVRRRQAR